MRSWGHKRAGYRADELLSCFPDQYHVDAIHWNETCLRLLYVPLRVLRVLSPFLSRFVARLCFEVDSRLPKGRDHILVRATRRTGQENSERMLPRPDSWTREQ
jgi:hypothetical protein